MQSDPGQDFATRNWFRLSPLSLLLFPVSMVFALLVLLRRWLYRAGLLRAVRLRVPVVVVGNLTVGGTGKTPLVLWVASLLQDAGLRPGIVLRGHGGRVRVPQAVSADSDPQAVGDEAVLLAMRAGCPVWVGHDRAAAAQCLLQENPACRVILCDDGLQHYGLARDYEMAVEDERGHGNGLMLPAGPLREPASRRVDATIVNAAESVPLPSRAAPVMRMRLVPVALRRVGRGNQWGAELDASSLAGMRLHAIAGIGNPQRFFATLRAMGLAAQTHVFPDHYAFTSADLEFPDCDAILMTEKDAVKCRTFARGDLIALSVEAQPDPALANLILKALSNGLPPA